MRKHGWKQEVKAGLGAVALAMALTGAATDALERPAVPTLHDEAVAAMDRLDVTAGGAALGLAIESQGNRALLDIRGTAALSHPVLAELRVASRP